jgi:hypothetical protein
MRHAAFCTVIFTCGLAIAHSKTVTDFMQLLQSFIALHFIPSNRNHRDGTINKQTQGHKICVDQILENAITGYQLLKDSC